MENEPISDDENYEMPPKKIKTEWSKSYSNKAMEMMKKMGYESDKGLGKLNQGRLEPIVAVQQDGRRGLGLKLDTVKTSANQWNPSCEDIVLPEKISWISNNTNDDYSLTELKAWLKTGDKKTSLKDEHLFCDPEILNNILESKTVFDQLNDNDLRRARSRSNPFETIRSSIFLNRAAVKMANIDSMCDYMFTKPRDPGTCNSLLQGDELLYFADICAGPGGFSEYVLYRKSWEAKGFGFTLRGSNDFKLDKFFAGSPESFDPFYGVKNDGNIFDEANQDSFSNYVLKHCASGVHFVMADGGFSVDGQENIQEILSKQLYLCQCLTAIKILRKNGSFVCKLFDLFTPFSVGLIFLMYKCFEEISIIKPNSSRPANSERYLVCKWKKANTENICTYLNLINNTLNDSDDGDVNEIVNLEIMSMDKNFMNYIIDSNNAIGKAQIVNLRKIAAFCQDSQLKETRQSEFRKRCLELWNLPDKLRQAPEVKSTDKLLEEILSNWYEDKSLLNSLPTELCSLQSLEKNIESIYDWYFVPIGRAETNLHTCSIFLCKSRGNLLRYIDKKWEQVNVNVSFEVSPNSLFYGEIVYEYTGEGRTQTRICGLHIIDAIMLGGVDIRRFKLTERIRMCEKYALSVNKPYKDGKNGPIRSKQLYKLSNLNFFFNDMRKYRLKENLLRFGLSLNADNKFFVPGGILIFCEISHNFFSSISKSTQMPYYFDKTTKISHYKNLMPSDVQNVLYASFRNSFSRRLLWKWSNTTQVEEDTNEKEANLLYRYELNNFLYHKQVR